VRGVLEVSLPLDRAIAQTKSNLHASIVSTVVVGGLGFVALVIVIGRLRNTSRKLELHAAKSRRSEQRFRTTIESASTAMLTIARDGNIVLTNPAAEQMFGYGEGELIGQLVEILVPQPVRQQHAQLRDDFFSDPELRRMGMGRDMAKRSSKPCSGTSCFSARRSLSERNGAEPKAPRLVVLLLATRSPPSSLKLATYNTPKSQSIGTSATRPNVF